jgi:hypothetical protein
MRFSSLFLLLVGCCSVSVFFLVLPTSTSQVSASSISAPVIWPSWLLGAPSCDVASSHCDSCNRAIWRELDQLREIEVQSLRTDGACHPRDVIGCDLDWYVERIIIIIIFFFFVLF